MAKPSIRAATAYCAFPEGTTMDEAWEQISRPFRGRTTSEEATNFVNAAYLEACDPMDSPNRLNERGIYSYRLTRKIDNHTAVQLAALISGGAEQLPETGMMTYSRGMFDKVFITPDEDNRLEF